MPYARRGLPILLLFAVALSQAVQAQDLPAIDAVGAYNHANVMRHRDTKPEKADPPQSASTRPADTLTKRDYDDLVEELRTEYRRRLDRDGRDRADAWLHARVEELRKRYRWVE